MFSVVFRMLRQTISNYSIQTLQQTTITTRPSDLLEKYERQ